MKIRSRIKTGPPVQIIAPTAATKRKGCCPHCGDPLLPGLSACIERLLYVRQRYNKTGNGRGRGRKSKVFTVSDFLTSTPPQWPGRYVSLSDGRDVQLLTVGPERPPVVVFQYVKSTENGPVLTKCRVTGRQLTALVKGKA